MTDITDNPPFGAPRPRPRIVEHADQMGIPTLAEPSFDEQAGRLNRLSDAMRRAAQPAPTIQTEAPAELTYLESIAKRLVALPYGDMVEMCEAIMAGDAKPASGDDLARLVHKWAKPMWAKAMGEPT